MYQQLAYSSDSIRFARHRSTATAIASTLLPCALFMPKSPSCFRQLNCAMFLYHQDHVTRSYLICCPPPIPSSQLHYLRNQSLLILISDQDVYLPPSLPLYLYNALDDSTFWILTRLGFISFPLKRFAVVQHYLYFVDTHDFLSLAHPHHPD